jgi:outer membrane protein assembly factor BamB
MPESPTSKHQLRPARILLCGCALLVCLFCVHAGAAAQSPPPTPGGDIFPLSTLWMVTLAPPAIDPAYDGDRAYVALKPVVEEDVQVQPASLVAVSLTDGSQVWKRALADVQSLAAGDSLVFACAGRVLQGLGASDGQSRWQLPLDAPLAAGLVYQRGWLIAVTQDGKALGIRARTGEKAWQVQLPSPASGEPAVSGDALYLALTDNRVMRLTLDTAAIAWDRKILSRPVTLLALDDSLFVGTRERWFYTLAPEDGRVRWRVRVGAAVVGPPAAGRSAVYFLSLDNVFRALDRSGGTVIWRQLLVRRARYGPFPAGSLLLLSGSSTSIQAFSRDGGAPAGSFDAPHDLQGPVHVVQGLVDRDFLIIALTGDGELLAIRPKSLEPDAFAISPRVALIAGFPRWRW